MQSVSSGAASIMPPQWRCQPSEETSPSLLNPPQPARSTLPPQKAGAVSFTSVTTDSRGVSRIDCLALTVGVPGPYRLMATYFDPSTQKTASASIIVKYTISLYKLHTAAAITRPITLGKPTNVVVTTNVSVADSSKRPPLMGVMVPLRLPTSNQPMMGYIGNGYNYPNDEALIDFNTQFATLTKCVAADQGPAAPTVTCVLNFTFVVLGAHGEFGGFAVSFMGRVIAVTVALNNAKTTYPKRLIYGVSFVSDVVALDAQVDIATLSTSTSHANATTPMTVFEANFFTVSFIARDANGRPIPNVAVSARAFNADRIITAYPDSPKYLVLNTSITTDAKGIANLTTALSSVGAVGVYYIRGRTGAVTVNTEPITVLSRVTSESALLAAAAAAEAPTKGVAPPAEPEHEPPLRIVGSIMAGFDSRLVTRDNTALVVNVDSTTTVARETRDAHRGENVPEAIPGKVASLRFSSVARCR